MKKTVFTIAAAAAMLMSCSVEEADRTQSLPGGETFTITASIEQEPAGLQSKTVLDAADGFKVAWEDDDRLSVIAAYSDGSYQAYEFVKGEGNIFTCDAVANPADITSVNVFYPYDRNNTAMDDEGYGRAGMGFGLGAVQSATDDSGHIDAPMYGYSVVSGGSAEVTMKHAATLFDVQVVNEGSSAIDVTEVRLSADGVSGMIGYYQINPQEGVIKRGSTYYSEAAVSVTDGTVESGATGHFYLTTVPFGRPEGSSLKVTVTASGQKYTVTKDIVKNTSFDAGKVNHIVDIAVDPVEHISIVPTYVAPSVAEGSFPVEINAYGEWSVIPDENTQGWLSVSPLSGNGSGTVTVTLSAPEDDSDMKTGSVRFVLGDMEETLTVQHGYAQKIGDYIWAKANVAEPGRFAPSPDAQGLYYQYNSKTGYPGSYPSTTGPAPSGIVLAPAYPVYTSWEEENDPCPEGWRVPTREEVQALFGTDGNERFVWMAEDAAATAGFACPGAVCGTDKASGESAVSSNMNGCIFLPCAGNLRKQNGTYQNPQNATMNTSTFHPAGEGHASSVEGRYIIRITSQTDYTLASSKWGWDDPDASYPVRCIADAK